MIWILGFDIQLFSQNMNIIFFGSAHFAVPSLLALIERGHRISCVVTQPDRKKGRGLCMAETEIKQVAKKHALKIYQPLKINTNEAVEFLKSFKPDLFIVIAYGQILSQGILNIPKIFSLNAHASLLPKYRGAAPINWALIKGEKITGVTIIKIVREMDAGEIVSQKTIEITDDDTAVTLEDKLSQEAAKLLLITLENIKNNNYSLTKQDKDAVSFAHKLKKEDGLINWNKPAQEIFNSIRGLLPWPGAHTYYKGKMLKIHAVKNYQTIDHRPKTKTGEIIKADKEGIVVAAGKGNLVIKELQLEGKKIMAASEFISGYKISPGDIFAEKK